jgi:hypothetical protein
MCSSAKDACVDRNDIRSDIEYSYGLNFVLYGPR